MKPISKKIETHIRKLRKNGLTHRQIASKIDLGVGTVFKYCRGITLTVKQKSLLNKINYQNSLGKLTDKEKYLASQKGGKNTSTHFQPKYSKQQIINILKNFNKKNGRIPTKREFVGIYRSVLRLFGTWNKAIIKSDLQPNLLLFTKKYWAKDGHKCDSLSEKIIDDWLFARKINHKRNVRYLNTKFTADFQIQNIFIEFFGLSGELKSYDILMKKKMEIIKKHKLKIIPIYSTDLFPTSKLNALFTPLMSNNTDLYL